MKQNKKNLIHLLWLAIGASVSVGLEYVYNKGQRDAIHKFFETYANEDGKIAILDKDEVREFQTAKDLDV